MQIVLARWTGDIVGIVTDACSDADLSNDDVAVLIELQCINDTLIAFPSIGQVLGIQVAEAYGFGNGMHVKGRAGIFQPVIWLIRFVDHLIPEASFVILEFRQSDKQVLQNSN
ncbi:hypothetical protein D3C86_1883650 [compost metagenome]